jgi:hypothetical protein
MTGWNRTPGQQRLWNERFLRALARLEDSKLQRELCPGCGRLFEVHPLEDYDECVRQVLNDTSEP